MGGREGLKETKKQPRNSVNAKMLVFGKEVNIPCVSIDEEETLSQGGPKCYRFIIRGVPKQFIALLLAFNVDICNLRCSVFDQPKSVYTCTTDGDCCTIVEEGTHIGKMINE